MTATMSANEQLLFANYRDAINVMVKESVNCGRLLAIGQELYECVEELAQATGGMIPNSLATRTAIALGMWERAADELSAERSDGDASD